MEDSKSEAPTPPPPSKTARNEGHEIAEKIAELRASFIAKAECEEVFDLDHKTEIKEKFATIFADVKCVLISLEGTLFITESDGVVPTPGALDMFKKLRQSGLKILLVTNTWLKPKRRILMMLNKLGFLVSEQDLFTSSDCCKIFMKKHGLEHPFLLVADDVLKDFPNMETLDPLAFDSIVLGLPSTMIDYRLLTKALNILYEGHPLLVLHPGRTEKAVGACKIHAPGIFSEILEFATDANRFIPSKPSVGFYVEACKYAGFNTQESVMIGDDITNDIRYTQGTCMKAILVKTGKYLIKDEEKYCDTRPDLLIDNFAKAVKYLLCCAGTDPDAEDDQYEKQMKKEKWAMEQSDFFRRLKSYANEDCILNKIACPERVGSYVW